MRIKTGETATVSIKVDLSYKCSKCGAPCAVTQTVQASASTGTAFGVNLNKEFVNEARYFLAEKLEHLCRYVPSHRLEVAKFNCKCGKCGYREPWARLDMPWMNPARVALAVLTVMSVGFSTEYSIVPFFVLLGLLVLSFVLKPVVIAHNKKKTDDLPPESIPKISVKRGGETLLLEPEPLDPRKHWVCYNCGEGNSNKRGACGYCGSTQAWSREKQKLGQVTKRPMANATAYAVGQPTAPKKEPVPAAAPKKPETAPKPETGGNVPHYVRLLSRERKGSWRAYTYQFVTYDDSFMRGYIQSVIDCADQVGNATVLAGPGAPEQEHTAALLAARCRVEDCPPLRSAREGIAVGVMAQGMMLKTFVYNATNRITVMAADDVAEDRITAFVNGAVHRAMNR